MDSIQRYGAIDAVIDAANDVANDAANDAAIDAAIGAAIGAANDYRRAGLPFPLQRQGWVAFPAVWTQGASESQECGKVCEITVGLGWPFPL